MPWDLFGLPRKPIDHRGHGDGRRGHGSDRRMIVDVDGQGTGKGERNGVRLRAGRGAQFPMPWDIFGQLGGHIDHHRYSEHHRGQRYVRRSSSDDV